MDTIFALATARGRAGVAVIRVSGPGAFETFDLFSFAKVTERRASLRILRDEHGDVLDEALVLAFEKGHSFTGERVVELHLHGSPAIIRACLDRLTNRPGFRMAEPGEFTRRALENDRLDLAQAEGLAELIDAETEAQRKQAQRLFQGALGSKVETWRERLIEAAALIEVTIDFADEDVPVDVSPHVRAALEGVIIDLEGEISGIGIAERIRNGFEVAIVGPPNAGKSTLLNALAGRDAAITSEIAGTTRDVIEVRMDLRGVPVTVLDTAGLRASDDVLEEIGVARAVKRAKAADIRVFLSADDALGLRPEAEDIVVQGKADLASAPTEFLCVSGKTGQGVPELVDRIGGILERRAEGAGTATQVRHRVAMERGLESLHSALAGLDQMGEQPELAAEDVRRAVTRLESLVGRVDIEHLLDEVFLRFCIGK